VQKGQTEFFFTPAVDLGASGNIQIVVRIDNPDNSSQFQPMVQGANHVMLDFHTGWESAMLSTPMNVYIDSVALLGDGTAVSATFGFDYPTTLTATGWQATGVFYNTAGSTLTGFAVTSVDTAP